MGTSTPGSSPPTSTSATAGSPDVDSSTLDPSDVDGSTHGASAPAAKVEVRDRLLIAAEQLFAERGLDGVSLREINTAAGTRNASALQYHYGNRAGLVRALLAKHQPEVDARRHAHLDTYDAEGRDDLRALSAALVRPFAPKLTDPGGPGYLQVLTDLLSRPRPAFSPAALEDPTDSMYRWRQRVETLLHPEAIARHRRFIALRFALTELTIRSREPDRNHDRFISELIDLVTGLLAAPISDESRRHDTRPA